MMSESLIIIYYCIFLVLLIKILSIPNDWILVWIIIGIQIIYSIQNFKEGIWIEHFDIEILPIEIRQDITDCIWR